MVILVLSSVFNIEHRMLSIFLSSQANIFWTGDSSFWCLFIDANLTAYDSNIGVQIYWYMFWFRPVSLIRLGLYEIVQSMDRKQTINGEGIYSFFFCWLLISISLSISLSRKNILFLICKTYQKHRAITQVFKLFATYSINSSLLYWILVQLKHEFCQAWNVFHI